MPTSSYSDPLPAWHDRPLSLTIKEMNNPYMVIEQFFKTWHLIDIRYCLKEWLCEVYKKEEPTVEDFLFVHDEVIRLAEAAWLLGEHQKLQEKEKRQRSINSCL